MQDPLDKAYRVLWPHPGPLPSVLSDKECKALTLLIDAALAHWGEAVPSATPGLPDPIVARLDGELALFAGDFGIGPRLQIAWQGRVVFDWLPVSGRLRTYRAGPWTALLRRPLAGLGRPPEVLGRRR